MESICIVRGELSAMNAIKLFYLISGSRIYVPQTHSDITTVPLPHSDALRSQPNF